MHALVDAGLLTFLGHCESRVASLLGKGFYTIGPCGEEVMGVLGAVLNKDDPMALHYRHVAASVRSLSISLQNHLQIKHTQIARQIIHFDRSVEDIALDRARAYTVSSLDPVTGGAHCSIGGTQHDYVVTSTLSSQAPPAVGTSYIQSEITQK